jgi:hypothetical protein
MSPLQSALARRLEGRRDKEVWPGRGKCMEAAVLLLTWEVPWAASIQ